MKLFRIPALVSGLFLILSVPLVEAQFNPGPNPITTTVTTPETIASGSGTIDPTGNLQVSGSSVARSQAVPRLQTTGRLTRPAPAAEFAITRAA